jgi:CrcB protein
MTKWLTIAIAGGLGAVSRYALAGLVQRWTGAAFPWGTFAVNAVGCLAFGFVVGVLEDRVALATAMRPYVLVGFLGAFTTFSTFAFESGELLVARQLGAFLGNVVGQTVVGVVLMFAGLAAGRAV